MCILQLVLTTDRPPASRAETMGPSAGSFSMRSLTSCVPKSGDRGGYGAGPRPVPPHPVPGNRAGTKGGQRGFGSDPKPRDPPTPCKNSSK